MQLLNRTLLNEDINMQRPSSFRTGSCVIKCKVLIFASTAWNSQGRVLIVSDFSSLLQSGASAWFFIPAAVLLGALHGLEPGHSKTMMAAFIVAIRGTVMQAVLLGLAATVSHTAIVWVVALAGLYFGGQWEADASEPYFQVASAVLILIIAVWMLVRTWRLQHQAAEGHADPHHPPHGAPGHAHAHDHATSHSHSQVPSSTDSGLTAPEQQDPHQLIHAADIRRRFGDRQVTTGQIVLFGLTGGLIPCSAAIAVLLMCLQVKQVVLSARPSCWPSASAWRSLSFSPAPWRP